MSLPSQIYISVSNVCQAYSNSEIYAFEMKGKKKDGKKISPPCLRSSHCNYLNVQHQEEANHQPTKEISGFLLLLYPIDCNT